METNKYTLTRQEWIQMLCADAQVEAAILTADAIHAYLVATRGSGLLYEPKTIRNNCSIGIIESELRFHAPSNPKPTEKETKQ